MLATPPSRLFLGIVPWYSVLIVTGICLALLIASREEKRLALPRDTVVDLALWVVPFGIIGARLYYVLFAWETFASNPISVLFVWQGGLAIYGAIIGGLIAVVLFARKRQLPLGALTDIIAPGLALAQAIGRWGNYFNMEAYGVQITSPAWQFFPAAVFIPGADGGTWHMATFFYESMWNLAVFIVLMLTRRRMHRTGDLSLWYFLLYGAGRLIIEGLRTDSLYAGSTIRISQVLALCICAVVLCIFTFRMLKLRGEQYLLQLRFLPMLVCCLLAMGYSIYMALAGVTGIEASTLQCAAYSLAMIVSCITVYTAEERP
ncbi:MAG: prolipoprotein diacylglyceryl transferase [Clostridia bacterium]|nr:prolipoprotein diacylglyceryl transferase [Clostridia bacterium]